MAQTLQAAIETAVRILKDAGAREVYLFGSQASGESREDSDIDLAVSGLPPRHYYGAVGTLLCELERSVDLVDLDLENPFTHYIKRKGLRRRVG